MVRTPLQGQQGTRTTEGVVNLRVQDTGDIFGAAHGEALAAGQTGTMGPTQDGKHLIKQGLGIVITVTTLVRRLTE
jgi:hypothetical protein